MTKIKVIYLGLFLANLRSYSSTQLNGKCGYPGKPYKASLEPDNKLQYDEGEEVSYQCNDYWFQPQFRKCERGQWMGKPARCADFVKNVKAKDVKIMDISNPEEPVTVLKYININLTEGTWKYPNSFADGRFKPLKLKVFGTKKYKWIFTFDVPVVKLFVKINMNFINYTYLSAEQKKNFTFLIDMFVSPDRKCSVDFQNEEKWKDNGGKINTFISCDSLSLKGHKRDVENPGNYLLMETESNVELHYYLLALIFGKAYNSHNEPFCGEPELSVSHSSRFIKQYREYEISCKSDKKWKQMDSESSLECVGDMKWSGSYPECRPIKSCPVDKLLSDPNSNETIVSSLDGLYFYNESHYYAIESSEAHYGCMNPTTHIVVGKESRICSKDGLWTSTEPYCYDQNKRKLPLLLMIGILVVTIIFVIILIVILFCYHTKQIKNRITKEIAIQKKPEEYDDIEYYDFGDKNAYNSYDVIDENEVKEDVCYTEHNYSSSKSYLKVYPDIEVQDYDDCMIGHNEDLAYNEIKDEPKLVPRISLKDKQLTKKGMKHKTGV